MGAAVSNTIMGVSIVFFVLVSLSFLIYLFRFISVIEDKLTKKKTSEPVKEQETVPVEEKTNLVDDLELIAVITAAIAASEGGDPGQYIVRSIKKVHRNQW